MKILGYSIPPAAIMIAVLLFATTPEQKSSLVDAAKEICNIQGTLAVELTDSFIATVNDKESKEQLMRLKAMSQVSLDVKENVEMLEDLHEKKRIKLDPRCVIVGAI